MYVAIAATPILNNIHVVWWQLYENISLHELYQWANSTNDLGIEGGGGAYVYEGEHGYPFFWHVFKRTTPPVEKQRKGMQTP